MQHRTKQSIVRRILKIEARTKALYKARACSELLR